MKKDENLACELYELFNEYRDAYDGEWQRLDKCERLYYGTHWNDVPLCDENEPRPVNPIIQSTIENVRADLIDQIPEAIVTADDPGFESTAEVLNAILRENHALSNYDKEYSRLIRDLLVSGYMVQEIGYDPSLNNGFGASFIRHVDVRSIMVDPCVTDIQDSRAIFKFSPRTREWFASHYPSLADSLKADSAMLHPVRDPLLNVSNKDMILYIECWLREYDAKRGVYSVHMLKLAGGQLLEDSRRQKPEGYFEHGKYPFVLTALFERRGCALGLGFADMFETQQRYSDKLDQIVLKNALMASRNKLLITGASGFDADDLKDWAKEIHTGDNLNGVTWFSTPPLPSYIIGYADSLRENVKEQSGSNDFSRGNTNRGVTAASAISALQEMSSKRARMTAKAVHGAFAEAVKQEIEVEREFAVIPRTLVVKTNGEPEYRSFSSEMMRFITPRGSRLPIEFKVSVKILRESRAGTAANNELVFKLLQSSMITPPVALELMQFDGKAQALALMKSIQ